MSAPDPPADSERPAWIGRVVLAAAFATFLVGVSGGVAWWWSPPRPNAADQVRSALAEAFEQGQVPARKLNSEPWTAVHAFGPLTTPGSVQKRLGHRELSDDFARVGADERLLVFVDEHALVASARLRKGSIEPGCMSAGRPDGLAPGAAVRIIAMRLRGRQILVAAEAATREVADCLRTMPSLRRE